MSESSWLKNYDSGVPAEIDFIDMPVPSFLNRAVAEFGDQVALVFENCQLTYRQLKDQSDRLATAMTRLGVEPGKRVAIQLPNIPQTVIAYQAAISLGAEVVMTNPLYTQREIKHQWDDSDVHLAVTLDALWDQKVRAMRQDLSVKTFIIASIPEYLGFPLNFLAPFKLKKMKPPMYAKVRPSEGVHLFKALVDGTPPDPPRPEIPMDNIAVLQYTGGTTGVSKGVVLSHRNLSYNVQQIQAWFVDATPGAESVLVCLPIFHVFGMTVGMNWTIFNGSKMVLQANPRDIPKLVSNISKHKVTLFPGVPALFNAINNFPGIEKIDVSSVKSCFSGSAKIAVDTLERFEKLTGSTIIEGFGMSETSPVTHCNPLKGLRKVGKVGVPVSNTDARVVDPKDPEKVMAVGEHGELVVRGPQVMQGYWNRPDETAKTIINGWLHTGDLAAMDEDGFFEIVGRTKDMILCSGYNVYPDEIDSVLMSHDKILEAATIGIPDEKRGETVKSFVVVQPGQTLTAADIKAFCEDKLAAYKLPREIEFIDALPKSAVMKTLRRELRDMEEKKRGQAPS